MKSVALWACVLILALSSSQSAGLRLLKHVKEPCINERNITYNDMYNSEEIISNVHTEPGHEERRNKIGCLMTCILKKQNLMEGLTIKEEDMLASLDELFDKPDVARAILPKCLEEVRNVEQECGKGFKFYACIMKAQAIHREKHEKEETEAKGDTTQSE